MPFLIRIILQRVLLFFYSILTFLGIAPEISIPTREEARIATEERQRIIADIVSEKMSNVKQGAGDIIETAENTLDRLTKINPSDNNVDTVPKTTETITTQPLNQAQKPPVQTTPQAPKPQITTQATAPKIPEQTILQTQQTEHPKTSSGIADVVVNIVCVRNSGNTIKVSTGSGVIVSPLGVVLTNAHVAQFFLLENSADANFNCAIYKENIPTFGYGAEILYISKDWVRQNYNLINEINARGTGEDDYALLLITRNTNPAIRLPSSFPYATINLRDVNIGDVVIAAGYPGGPTSLIDITKAGNLRTAILSVLDIFTFGGNNIDVFTIGESDVGAKGASGGGIFSGRNSLITDLIGIIVTTDGTNGRAKINAITTQYINRDIKIDSGEDLSYYLSGNIQTKSTSFIQESSDLIALLLRNF